MRKNVTLLQLLLMAMCLVCTSFVANSQSVIAGWSFTGQVNYGDSLLAASVTDPNLTVGGLVRGTGLPWQGSGVSNAWGATKFTPSGTLDSEIDAAKFYTFTLTADAGYTLSLTTIGAYNIRRSATGPSMGQWQYQVGNQGFINIGGNITWGNVTTAAGNPQAAIDLSSIADLQNVPAGVTVTIRLVNFGASSTAGTNYLNTTGNASDLFITGNVAATGQIPTAISSPSVHTVLVKVQYFTVSGVAVKKAPTKGVYIEKRYFNNGQTETVKVVK